MGLQIRLKWILVKLWSKMLSISGATPHKCLADRMEYSNSKTAIILLTVDIFKN